MYADDVQNLRCRRQRTNDGRRPGTERREDLGGDCGVSLIAGMKPVGSPEITRPAVLPVEVMDAVEPIQTDKPSAVPLAYLRDDRIEAVGPQPAADAEDAGL